MEGPAGRTQRIADRGSAEVEAKAADSTTMDVEIRKSAASTSYAWHMHDGNCAPNGSVVGAMDAYPTLKTDDKGTQAG